MSPALHRSSTRVCIWMGMYMNIHRKCMLSNQKLKSTATLWNLSSSNILVVHMGSLSQARLIHVAGRTYRSYSSLAGLHSSSAEHRDDVRTSYHNEEEYGVEVENEEYDLQQHGDNFIIKLHVDNNVRSPPVLLFFFLLNRMQFVLDSASLPTRTKKSAMSHFNMHFYFVSVACSMQTLLTHTSSTDFQCGSRS